MDIFLISYKKIFLMSSGIQKMVDILRHAEDIFAIYSRYLPTIFWVQEDIKKTFRRYKEDIQKTCLLVFSECRGRFDWRLRYVGTLREYTGSRRAYRGVSHYIVRRETRLVKRRELPTCRGKAKEAGSQ